MPTLLPPAFTTTGCRPSASWLPLFFVSLRFAGSFGCYRDWLEVFQRALYCNPPGCGNVLYLYGFTVAIALFPGRAVLLRAWLPLDLYRHFALLAGSAALGPVRFVVPLLLWFIPADSAAALSAGS